MNTLDSYNKNFWVIDYDRYTWLRQHAPKSKKIIDIGCCYGVTFKGYDSSSVTSVDLDDYSHLVDNFVQADARDLPFPNLSFDIAVLGEVLEHQMTIEDVKKVLLEALRVAPKVLITVPNEYLWKEGTEKFKSYEDVVKENNGDLISMAKRSAPHAKSWDPQLTHIFHHHHFSPYELEDMVHEISDRDCYVYILPNDGDPSIGAAGTTAIIIE
jgi:SAM-dependent methyltransferase